LADLVASSVTNRADMMGLVKGASSAAVAARHACIAFNT